MRRLDNNEMYKVVGGSNTITASILSAISKLITTFYDLGRAIGSSIRRIREGDICSIN